MSILAKHLELVKGQVDFHQKMGEKVGAASWRGRLHIATAEKFGALVADLEAADKALDLPTPQPARSPVGPIQLSLNMEDVANLPEELLQELNLTEGDKTEFAILNAIEDAGGIISLDKLLIALYRRTGDIHKRQNLTSRLYRMMNNNRLFNVPGKKGVYSTEQMTVEEAAMVLGGVVKEEA